MFVRELSPGAVLYGSLLTVLFSLLVSGALYFKLIKIDPAVASGPLITTINDLVAVVTYYGLSWLFLINILHLG